MLGLYRAISGEIALFLLECGLTPDLVVFRLFSIIFPLSEAGDEAPAPSGFRNAGA